MKRSVCEINCREVVFWSSIQQLLAKAHSIQFYALKKNTFFSKYLIDIAFDLTSPYKCKGVEKIGWNGTWNSLTGEVAQKNWKAKF